MLEARNLHKVYETGPVLVPVLKGVSLTVGDGDFVAITGPSGAGKSTLLHLLAGLDVPTSGDVLWNGQSLARMSDRERAHFRNHTIGVVFQFYHLLLELTAVENVMLPALVNGHAGRGSVKGRALACLEQVGLSARAAHKPNQLSGGEQQRVAIARAFMNEPKVIFCDEPTGNLDSATGQDIARLLVGLQRQHGMSLVLVTHEEALAQLAQRRLPLRDGQFIEHSTQHTDWT